MTVMEMAGKQCQDVVVCAHVREDWQQQQQQSDGSSRTTVRPAAADATIDVCLEATLLVLEDPATVEAAAAAAAGAGGTVLRGRLAMASSSSNSSVRLQQGYPFMTPPPPPMPAAAAAGGARGGTGAKEPVGVGGRKGPGDGKQEGGEKKARPSWSAMSAIAGGSAAAAVRLRGQHQVRTSMGNRQRPTWLWD